MCFPPLMLRLLLTLAPLTLAVIAITVSPAAAQRLQPTPDLATSPAEIATYQKCLRTAEKTPDEGFEEAMARSEEHTSELQSPDHLVCRLLLEKKKHGTIIRAIVHDPVTARTARMLIAYPV